MKGFFNGYSNFVNLARQFEADAQRLDAQDFARRARLRALLIERAYLEQEASGNLGNARLGNLDDATAASLLNSTGLYTGALGCHLLFLNADGHNLVYARAGGGKGTTSAQPNLAHYPGSMFVIDVKDGELHYSSARHRAKTLGHKVIAIDPWNVTGNGGARINPLDRLRQIVASGKQIDDEADEITLILLPRGKADAGDSGWARKGARRKLTMKMKHLAYAAPDKLTLTELWRYVNCSDTEMAVYFEEMIACGREDIAGPAAAMKSVFQEAPKQFEAYRADAIDALAAYSPGSTLTTASSANDFDFSIMKHKPVTAYLTIPSSKLGVAAPWIAMVINHAIEQIAAATGPSTVRFLIDEFAQLPMIPAIMKCLRLYRGRGILLSLYCQGRFSLRDAGYSEAAIKEIEDQAACFQMWGVEDPSLLRDVEYWSGNTSVVQVNPSHSGGPVAHASFGRSERARKVLQVEDIRLINEGQQIIKIPGFPLFVADRVPYWRITPWKDQLRDVRELHFGKKRK